MPVLAKKGNHSLIHNYFVILIHILSLKAYYVVNDLTLQNENVNPM